MCACVRVEPDLWRPSAWSEAEQILMCSRACGLGVVCAGHTQAILLWLLLMHQQQLKHLAIFTAVQANNT